VTAKGGKVRIVYDPRLVLISENPPQVTFADPVSRAARYTMIRWRMTQQTRNWSAAYRAFIDAGGEAKDFKYQKDRKAELAEVAAQLGKEEDPLIRPWLLLSYFTDGSGEGDPEIAKLFFREFPGIVKRFPANQVYQLFSPLVSAGQLTGFGSGFKDALLGAVDEVEDINTKGNMFYNILTQIQSKKNDAVMQEYLELALERLANNPWLNMIKSRFAVKKVLGAGKEIPAFRVRSLQDTTLIISSQIMKGKVYLIDFWATWSSTCIRNMESMQRVYEKFKTRGFEIVSLSLDAKADDVRAFRGGQWKMPWLHALVTTNTGLLADFSVSVLPKQYLVDGAGKILATPKDLEEKPLERMLEHVFGAVR
jgi:thiol-disulfide isomerase/thioredoxin